MRVAISAYGPFDVSTIREIVEHIDEHEDGETIYVQAGERLTPSTPAAVTSAWLTSEELRCELGFRYLTDVDEAKEAIDQFGYDFDEQALRDLLEMIDEYRM